MLDIHVELLYPALFEIQVLRLDSPRKLRRVERGRDGLKILLQKQALRSTVKGGVPKWAWTEKIVGFSKVWRVLPQPLRPLVPRRVMVDGEAATDRSRLASPRFPG